jgi:8-oxo-dGTP pyrophosphatase MutT (NUDIX family)
MRYLKVFETYWGTIGAGIVPFCVNTKRFLIGLRSGYVMEPHTYGGFGGKLDIDEGVDETIEIAAKRELSEETGYYK